MDIHNSRVTANPEGLGRPVRIVSIGNEEPLAEKIRDTVDAEGARGSDIIVTRECFNGHDPEPLDGPLVQAYAGLAAKHSTYIVVSMYRKDGARTLNSPGL